jgi:HPt (histidine-containing phosphotransfer) domain-containing protein
LNNDWQLNEDYEQEDMMTLLKWNKEFALEQAADDMELLEELLDIFKTSFASDIQLIQSGLATANANQIGGAAHSIKGASSSLGIEGITAVAKSIEDDCKNGSLEQAEALVGQLEKMLEEVKAM